MSGAFIFALNLGILTVKNAKGYTCTCGLTIGIDVENLDPGVGILLRPNLLEAAHQRHHNNHFGVPATLYMIGEPTPPSNNALAAAQCSCDYDKEHPRD